MSSNTPLTTHHKLPSSGIGRTVLIILLVIAVLALIVTALIKFDIQAQIVSLLEWIEQLGIWGPVLFTLLDMLVVVLVLPGVVVTLAAGFLFGIFWGSLYIVIGTTLGATIAFLIARYLLGEQATRFIMKYSKLRILLDSVKNRSGWKFVLLTRLIPFFPFKPTNYVFGLSGFRLRDFFIGTLFGIIPFTLTNVYIGSLAADLATLGTTQGHLPAWQWVAYGVGLVVAVGALIYVTRTAQRILNKQIKQQEKI